MEHQGVKSLYANLKSVNTWIGMAPCGKVFPAKMMFLDLLLGRITVEAGAATLLMVVFFGSLAKELTATGMAVATSRPP